jgi:hypothetical protein
VLGPNVPVTGAVPNRFFRDEKTPTQYPVGEPCRVRRLCARTAGDLEPSCCRSTRSTAPSGFVACYTLRCTGALLAVRFDADELRTGQQLASHEIITPVGPAVTALVAGVR